MALDQYPPEYQGFIVLVVAGLLREVERHLETHPEFLDLSDGSGWAPLHYAVVYGKDSVVELLLQRGSASLDLPNRNGVTPLHFTAVYGRDSTMKILKAIGAAILSLRNLDPEKIERLRAPIPEEEILEIRFRVYFSRSLLSALL